MGSKSKALVKNGDKPEDMERLLEGKPVMYAVKRQLTRVVGRDPILALTPLSIYNADSRNSGDLLVSLEGSGCWCIHTNKKIKAVDLYYTGLTMIASRQLADRLNKVYKGE